MSSKENPRLSSHSREVESQTSKTPKTSDAVQPSNITSGKSADDKEHSQNVVKPRVLKRVLCARNDPQDRNRRQVLVKWLGEEELAWVSLREVHKTEELRDFEDMYGDAGINDGPAVEYLEWF
ncbi:hypothetical protein AAE478_010313 [Parahypoxylon ruwenzoriense]